jgi:hypothetical protein
LTDLSDFSHIVLGPVLGGAGADADDADAGAGVNAGAGNKP